MSDSPRRGVSLALEYFCPACMTRYATKIARCPNDGWPAVEDQSGTLLNGRFQLDRLLGVGGMGSTVWLAQQTSMSRQVAIKLLPSMGDVTAQRFEREARIAASLRHPNIVTIFDYGQTLDRKLFLVMEMLEGVTLEQVLRKESTIEVGRACHILLQVLRALSHAHGKRVVHRDLKPSNLFLSPTDGDPDFVKVLDFGLAKTFGDGEEAGLYPDVTGQRQTVCGTPTYMSPEQWRGETDNRTDIYALGVILYRMLAGRAPFIGGPDYELFHRVITEPVPPIGSIPSAVEVPLALEQIILKALAKSPGDRYSTADEMRRAVESFLDDYMSMVPPAPSEGTPARPSHPIVDEPGVVSLQPTRMDGPPPQDTMSTDAIQSERQRSLSWVALGAVCAIGCGLLVSYWKNPTGTAVTEQKPGSTEITAQAVVTPASTPPVDSGVVLSTGKTARGAVDESISRPGAVTGLTLSAPRLYQRMADQQRIERMDIEVSLPPSKVLPVAAAVKRPVVERSRDAGTKPPYDGLLLDMPPKPSEQRTTPPPPPAVVPGLKPAAVGSKRVEPANEPPPTKIGVLGEGERHAKPSVAPAKAPSPEAKPSIRALGEGDSPLAPKPRIERLE